MLYNLLDVQNEQLDDHAMNNFTISDISRALSELGMAHEIFGESDRRYSFKSLRNIEPGGIYFITPGVLNPPRVPNSIIIGADKYEADVSIVVDDPQLAFYQLMRSLLPPPAAPKGVHPTAIVDEASIIHADASVGPYCVLEGCEIKSGVRLHSHVVVMAGSIIEEDVTVEAHSTIGSTSVAWVWDQSSRRRIMQPQVGFVRIGKGSFLGTGVAVGRGSVNEWTSLGANSVVAQGSKIGHGSVIGEGCHLSPNVSLAGNVTLGDRCFIGTGAVIRSQTRLAEGTIVGAGATVVRNVTELNLMLVGSPAVEKDQPETMAGVPKTLK